MKNTLKSFMTLAVILIGSSAVFAQNPNSNLGKTQDVLINAKILRKIETTKVSDVNFGTIQTETAPFMDPKNQNPDDLGFTYSIGVVEVSATHDEPIRVQFADSIHLVAPGPLRVTYVPLISASYGEHTAATGADSSILLGEDVYTGLNPSGPDHAVVTEGTGRGGATNSGGIIYTYPDPVAPDFEKTTLFIGGSLHDVGTKTGAFTGATQAGTYVGTLTINLLYQ